MRRYWMMIAACLLLLLLLFFAVEAAHISILVDPIPWLSAHGTTAAVLSVGLLVVDVLIPVPSSLVMVAHGALFGIWIGTLLSLLGGVGATLFGFALGRAGNTTIRRFVTPAEHDRAGALLARWGVLAIVVSRPVPMLAETVAILAGASPLGWTQATLAALAGSFPAAVLYALAGATAMSVGSAWRLIPAVWKSGRKQAVVSVETRSIAVRILT